MRAVHAGGHGFSSGRRRRRPSAHSNHDERDLPEARLTAGASSAVRRMRQRRDPEPAHPSRRSLLRSARSGPHHASRGRHEAHLTTGTLYQCRATKALQTSGVHGRWSRCTSSTATHQSSASTGLRERLRAVPDRAHDPAIAARAHEPRPEGVGRARRGDGAAAHSDGRPDVPRPTGRRPPGATR